VTSSGLGAEQMQRQNVTHIRLARWHMVPPFFRAGETWYNISDSTCPNVLNASDARACETYVFAAVRTDWTVRIQLEHERKAINRLRPSLLGGCVSMTQTPGWWRQQSSEADASCRLWSLCPVSSSQFQQWATVVDGDRNKQLLASCNQDRT
jgi:hypothetical protein